MTRVVTRALVALAFSAGLAACASKNADDSVLSDIPMVSEGVLACESMLRDFDRFDPDTASEAELERLMVMARENQGLCERQFLANAVTPADKAFYQHRAQQFRLNELVFEAALSRRFDGFVGYCVILDDMLTEIADGMAVMNQFFAEQKPKGEDLRRLTELYRLDAHSIEVLSTQVNVTCTE